MSANSSTGTTAYPLAWPTGRPRIPEHRRESSRFEIASFAVARDGLLKELRLLGAKYVTLSTNIELRNDGLPYANRKAPDDPGVAVYFTDRKGRKLAFSCDRWRKIEENLRAIQKHIEALRGIERWGTGDAVEAAFSGYQALPPAPTSRPWAVVLECSPVDYDRVVEQQYRILSMRHHPDRGGSSEKMAEINAAFDAFKKERGL